MTWDNEERFMSDKGRIEYQRQRAEKAEAERDKMQSTCEQLEAERNDLKAKVKELEAELERYHKMAQALDHMTDHYMYSLTISEDEFKEFTEGCEKAQQGEGEASTTTNNKETK